MHSSVWFVFVRQLLIQFFTRVQYIKYNLVFFFLSSFNNVSSSLPADHAYHYKPLKLTDANKEWTYDLLAYIIIIIINNKCIL